MSLLFIIGPATLLAAIFEREGKTKVKAHRTRRIEFI